MEYKVIRIDESEARVEFEGQILISYEDKSEFVKELNAVIDRFAI